MPATQAFTLTPSAWTLLSDGNENCTVALRNAGVIRLYRGLAAPSDLETNNYVTVSSARGGYAYGSLASPNNKIYGRSEGRNIVVEVDAG